MQKFMIDTIKAAALLFGFMLSVLFFLWFLGLVLMTVAYLLA
jgi:hypothetical protein